MSFTQSRLELVYERDGRVGERVFSGPQSRATGVRLRAGFLLYLGFALTLTPTTLTRRISRQIRLSTFFIHPRWRYTPRLGLVFYWARWVNFCGVLAGVARVRFNLKVWAHPSLEGFAAALTWLSDPATLLCELASEDRALTSVEERQALHLFLRPTTRVEAALCKRYAWASVGLGVEVAPLHWVQLHVTRNTPVVQFYTLALVFQHFQAPVMLCF